MRQIFSLLRPVYYLLYHHFAWTYDLVADIVSLGQWKDWVRSALPYLEGRVLELGFGPGHLQQSLHVRGQLSFGVDESRFMARQAARRLKRSGADLRLVRGLAQALPFPAAAFDTVAATFPADYIFSKHTLDEAYRVLTPQGRLIILPMAWLTGNRPLERLVRWAMRVSGETTGVPGQLPQPVQERFAASRFEVRKETVKLPKSMVSVLIAQKISAEKN
jgi:ubiquinone/menaquinone biosynthesis C-methylase UbiE